jgi:hypothetical protein
MTSRKDTSAVATFGDHEVITPENKLRKAVSTRPYLPAEDDPVVRAEKALTELSHEFTNWMDQECDRLDQARRAVAEDGFNDVTRLGLFHAAHDIKGDAATFGYPALTAARDAGVTEFLAKPISAKGLYQRIVNVVANPRPFIKTKTYFGPDRRRNVNPNYVGTERRKGGKADVIKQVPLLDKVRAPS